MSNPNKGPDISAADLQGIRTLLRERGAYEWLEFELGDAFSRIVHPSLRPKTFITFVKTSDNTVEVNTGWLRGPIWGAGQEFTFTKIDIAWRIAQVETAGIL